LSLPQRNRQPSGEADRQESAARSGASSGEPVLAQMVTARAVIIALLLIPINVYWVQYMEVVRYSGHPTTISLFFNVVFALAVLLGLNAIVRRFRPTWAMEPGEMLTIYIMLALSSAIAGHDMIEVLTPILAHVHYFARPENQWATDILPWVPRWLTVHDPRALAEYYQGTGTLYTSYNIRAWLGPVLWWTGFLSVLGFMMLCINTLLRRQWTENEKLSYPLVMLPLEMVSPRTNLFKTRLFWLGVAICAGLELWNGMAFLYPSIPMLPLKFSGPGQDLGTAFTTRPWNAIGWTPVAMYPFGIALGMLLPVDLLFSAWFFAWVWRLERVFGSATGYGDVPGFPYLEQQSFGAYIGLAVFALWTSRSHFVRIWHGLFKFSVDLKDSREPIPYRWAALGLAVGCCALFTFCKVCGMSPYIIAATFLIYFTLAIAITRMRAELGPPAHDLHMSGPDSMIPALTHSDRLARPDLAMFSMFYGFNRAYRSHPMPIELEGFKMAERIGSPYKRLFWAMMLAIAFGGLAAFWANLDQSYRVGAAEKIAPPNVDLIFGGEPWNRMHDWIKTPQSPQQIFNTRVAVMVGFFITLALNTLRLRLPWFPLHPVGYAVSSSWSLSLLWMPLLIAWIIKMLLLRYGGLRAYRNSLPFFLGVIMGECVLGSLWMIVGIIMHVPTYAFWP
jgi:hypothetical protein